MAISRMNIPRQHYGLGSLVRKAVKAVTRPVKQIMKSPMGKAALLGATMYGLGGGTFFGKGLPGLARGAAGTTGFQMGNIMPNIMNYMVGQAGGVPGAEATKGFLGAGGKFGLGKTAIAGAMALAAIPDPTGTAGFNMAKRKGTVEQYLRSYYKDYYKNNWEEGWNQDEEDNFVAKYTSEYNQGGRVGFYAGPDEDDLANFQDDDLDIIELMKDQGVPIGEQVKSLDAGAQPIVKTGNYETKDSKLVGRYNEHKQEADVPMSFDEFERFESMTAYGGPFAVLRKLGFNSKEISNLFRNLSQMGKEYKTNENFKHLYKLLANPMENKEAIINIMQQYGKKIPKVLKKPRKKKAIGGIMGGRVGLKVIQDLLDDDEEEYAQGGRIGLYAGTDPEDYPEEEDDVTPWELQQEEGVPIGPMAGGTPEHFEALFKMYINMGLTPNEAYSKVIEIYASMRKDEAQGERIGAFGGGVMGIEAPGMRLPGIPQMAPDGLEYNMKAGGFQNLGAQEGKDEVNAKLAKNEFVMTADAVRGAGDGSIEVGAQRMYDTMKRLEGKVA